jgi:hypothetical protein
MKGRIFAGFFLCSVFIVIGGDAQNRDALEKPVWTLTFVKVKPEGLGPTLAYLDDHWMPVRAEAKRQGAVLDYHLISDLVASVPGERGSAPSHRLWDPSSILLLTEYKNMDAYLENREALRIDDHPPTNGRPGFRSFYELSRPDDYYIQVTRKIPKVLGQGTVASNVITITVTE